MDKKTRRPFHLKRHPTLQQTPIDQLHLDNEREYDAYFIASYQKYLQGKLKGAWTRVKITSIVPGLIKHKNGRVSEIIEYAEDRAFAASLSAEIRKGMRPSLTLYPGYLNEHKGKLICADDLATFYAYRDLGVNMVPSLILGKAFRGTESQIISKFSADGSVSDLELFAQNPTHAMTTLDCGNAISFSDALRKLSSYMDLCLEALAAFDIPENSETKVRYHETLNSIAYRFREGLKALGVLHEKKLLLQGRPIVRSMYELFLNFYLDWLCPHQMGPLLQSMAEISRLPKGKNRQKLYKLVRERFGGLVDLCEVVAEKGRMSPLGEAGHERIYSKLSPIAHQDFGVTQQYVHLLASGKEVAPSQEESDFLIRTLDVLVCAAAYRILDDVGATDALLKEGKNK
jgi:hypothetical protein